jgi:hypothetical protein
VISERFVIVSAPIWSHADDWDVKEWQLVGAPASQMEAERVAEISATNDPLRRFYVAELKTCSTAEAKTLEVG